MNLVTKWCKGCGKIMRDVNPCKRYCDKCLHDKEVRYAQERQKKKMIQKAEAKRRERIASALPHRPHSIAWCVREAEKRHMSYGRFVSLGLDKKETTWLVK